MWLEIISSLLYKCSPVIIHDGVEPVSNGKYRAVSELSPYRPLNEVIRFHVYRSRGFIKNKDFTFAEQRTRQTY